MISQQQIWDLQTNTIATAKALTPLVGDIVLVTETNCLYEYVSSNSGDIPITAGGSLRYCNDKRLVQVTSDTTFTKEELDAYRVTYVLAAPADANNITISNDANVRGGAEVFVLYDGTATDRGDVVVNLNSFQSQGTITLTQPGEYCSHIRSNNVGNANFWSLISRSDIDTRASVVTNTNNIATNATDISNNADDIGDLDTRVTAIENEPPPTFIQNGTAAAVCQDDETVILTAQNSLGVLMDRGTISYVEDVGTVARSNGPTDDAASVPLNQFLTPAQMISLNATSPADAVGVMLCSCSDINNIQARTNIYASGNVYQGVVTSGCRIYWNLDGVTAGSTIYMQCRVANNQGIGQVKTGTISIVHDGVTTTENFNAPWDSTPGFADVNVQYTVPDSSTVSNAEIRFNIDSGEIGVLVTDIQIDLERRYGTEVDRTGGVGIDRKFYNKAAYLDVATDPAVNISTMPDNSVFAKSLGGNHTYYKKATIGGSATALSMGEKVIQRFSMVAGLHWYRVAVIPATARIMRGCNIFTLDGSHSSNARFDFGIRARIAGAPTNIASRQHVPNMIFQRMGSFAYLGGSTSDDQIRGVRFAQDGDSSGNRVIYIDFWLWQDSSSAPCSIYWDQPLDSDQDNSEIYLTDDITVDPVETGFTMNEYPLRGYLSRNGNAYAVNFNRTSFEEEFLTASTGLDITAPFVGT